MKDEILSNMDNPRQLEKLYRDDKPTFRREFNAVYPAVKDHALAPFWYERLNFEQEEISWGTAKELLFILLACLLAGTIAKFPQLFGLNEELFYQRNIGFIIFPLLSAYFAWKKALKAGKIALVAGSMLLSLLYINLLPQDGNSDTLLLACIHLPLFLWAILGVAFVGNHTGNLERRLGYLRYNGDLVVMTTLIVIAGGILTGITIGLFSLIGYKIEEFYFQYIVIFGLPSAPIVGTYLTQTNPQLVSKVSPVIAKIFSPLVLIMLVVYLVAIIVAGKDPYNDREFLLMFNVLLIGVMALIFFSIAEGAKGTQNRGALIVLFLLSAVTVVVNGIALSAIMFRISEWGITPNRLAVMGGNVLILINLLLVAVQLFRTLTRKSDIVDVGRAIAAYLPVYCLWVAVVVFLFPFLFGFA